MSHWGEPLVVDGVTMVPLVAGGTVESILVTNREQGGLSRFPADCVAFCEATTRHTGRPYSDWLARLPSLQQMQ